MDITIGTAQSHADRQILVLFAHKLATHAMDTHRREAIKVTQQQTESQCKAESQFTSVQTLLNRQASARQATEASAITATAENQHKVQKSGVQKWNTKAWARGTDDEKSL